MHRPALIPVPTFALQLALGEIATLVRDGQRAVPQKLSDIGFTFRFTELNAALDDLLQPQRAAARQSAELVASPSKGQEQ